MSEPKKTPEIRFTGFTDDWEQRKVSEYANFFTGNGLNWNDISDDGEQECILYGNLYTDYGMITENIVYRTNTEIKNPVYSEYGDVLIPASDTTPTGLARATSLEKSGVLLGGDINIIRPNKGINGSCLSLALNANRKELIRLIKGTTVRHIHNSEIKDIVICLPKLETEQVRISSYFKRLDHLITLHQRKLDKLGKIKKAMLDKMFPKNNEKVPEIRFKEFTDDWEQRKFGDIGTVSMCKRIFKNETSDKGEIPFYKIGTFGGEPDAYISRELFEEYKGKFSYPNKGDILLSASGTIGRIVEYDGEEAYFQDSNIVWLSHDESVCNKFLKVLYPIIRWDGIEGSTIQRLYNDNFLKTRFMMPSVEEQEKIGEYFSRLDNLITLHQRKLDKLIVIKKALLLKMFV